MTDRKISDSRKTEQKKVGKVSGNHSILPDRAKKAWNYVDEDHWVISDVIEKGNRTKPFDFFLT